MPCFLKFIFVYKRSCTSIYITITSFYTGLEQNRKSKMVDGSSSSFHDKWRYNNKVNAIVSDNQYVSRLCIKLIRQLHFKFFFFSLYGYFTRIVCRMEVDIVEKSPRRGRGDYSTLLFSWKFLFSTARSFIGYFEVTWHLTVKLFFAKISERAKLQHLWHVVIRG